MVQDAYIPTAILFFLVGNLSGFLLAKFYEKIRVMQDSAIKNFLIVAVTVVWVLSVFVSWLSPQYKVPVEVHGMFGIIVGFFFYPGKDKK